MNKIVFHLPWPPTVNSYYSCTRYGIHISKKGKVYADKVWQMAREQNVILGLTNPLSFTVILYPPDRRKRDLDNHMKALQDALTRCGVWEDDSLINQLYVYRGEIVKGGKVSIMIHDEGMIIPDNAEHIIFDQ